MSTLNVHIEIDGKESITPQDVEDALNYYFGIEIVIGVTEITPQNIQRSPTTCAPAEASGARYCQACGSLLEDRSVHCDNCGTDTPGSGG